MIIKVSDGKLVARAVTMQMLQVIAKKKKQESECAELCFGFANYHFH